MKKLKVAVIGLGRIYPRHIDDSINQLNELELVAVCDIDKKLAQKVGKKYQVQAFNDYKEMIKNTKVDIISICTPNATHYDIGLYLAKQNIHTIMEKPLAINYEKTKKLIEAYEASKATLFPVLQVRYNPAVIALKQYVDQGFLGKIFSANLIIRWCRPQEYFNESPWKGTKKIDGGTLLTQGIHYIDVMQYVMGCVDSLYAITDLKAHKIEVEDMANAILNFKSGARANLEFTVNTYPKNLECSLTVLGEYGTVKIGGNAMNEIDIWEVKNTPKPVIPRGLEPNVYANGMYIGSCPNHIMIYKNLVNVLIEGKKSYIEAKDALESIKIIDYIKKSNDEKKTVNL